MKRLAYSFLLIVLLSCGRQSHLSDSHIQLQIRESNVQDFYLLSVRDNILMISPYDGQAVTDDSLIAHAFSMPFEKIEAVFYKEEQPASALNGLAGCLIGTVGGGLAGVLSMRTEDDLFLPLAGVIIGSFFGFGGGMLIGNALKHPEDRYIIEVKTHIDELRDLSIYPDKEPAELGKIK